MRLHTTSLYLFVSLPQNFKIKALKATFISCSRVTLPHILETQIDEQCESHFYPHGRREVVKMAFVQVNSSLLMLLLVFDQRL